MKGGIFHSSTFTVTSLRGAVTLKTPSAAFQDPLMPVTCSMRLVSSAPGAPKQAVTMRTLRGAPYQQQFQPLTTTAEHMNLDLAARDRYHARQSSLVSRECQPAVPATRQTEWKRLPNDHEGGILRPESLPSRLTMKRRSTRFPPPSSAVENNTVGRGFVKTFTHRNEVGQHGTSAGQAPG